MAFTFEAPAGSEFHHIMSGKAMHAPGRPFDLSAPVQKVLLVTPGLGYANKGSFYQVARGLELGLRAHGVDAHLWDRPEAPEDAEEATPSLLGVSHLVWVGPPLFGQPWVTMLLSAAEQRGVRTSWMVAANSTTVPSSVRGFVRQHHWDALLTPSPWSKVVLEQALVDEEARPIVLVPHGVEVPTDLPVTRPGWAHSVAGNTGRKGTPELLEAVGDDILLHVYADALAVAWLRDLVPPGRPNVQVHRGYDRSAYPGWWMHDKIVHPSRAEGFGISAVEAYLLGRTVLMRQDTGEPKLPVHLIDRAWCIGDWEEWEGGDGACPPPQPPLRPLTITPPALLRQRMQEVDAGEPSVLRSIDVRLPDAAARESFLHAEAVRPLIRAFRGLP